MMDSGNETDAAREIFSYTTAGWEVKKKHDMKDTERAE